ncbi:FAD-binding oxidoreductase [Rhizobium sp. P44RR-XXIV]|uniref:NAD(P)/FAD-dependent oxidoreductase n=1 Tax=Rhizobium sp. P44RR-XXIV TaxID=1921145 RepID=UPI00098416ED|nr:FAD-binding oxidoreductase [Rhizobium sp. P44RR-XXIV]TIX90672.1 FAD-binding oxidoreductase [Rhizobium sp. P44RR-XXIV]
MFKLAGHEVVSKYSEFISREPPQPCAVNGSSLIPLPLTGLALDNSAPLTQRHALRRDQPLWAAISGGSIKTGLTIAHSAYDVIIVGAGISGALMAHALSGKNLRVLVVDRRSPVQGSSLASTAMIQHEIDVPLHVLQKTMGVREAQRVWQRSASAVEQLAGIVHDLNVKCSFQRKRTLFLAGEEYGSRALKAEWEARNEAGIGADLLGASMLREQFQIVRTAAIDSTISASANPAQLTAGVLRRVGMHGTEIVSGVDIKDVRAFDEDVVLSTSEGALLSARHVVFCTGYEFLESLANKSQKVISTWALASRPKLKRPDWLDQYLVWEGSDPYLYFRSTPDGRVILGGEDENGEDAYKDEAKRARKTKALVEKLADLTGIAIGKPEFEWSAAFAVTPDGLPMIGRVPHMKNVFVTMGFGGNGITFSQIAAELIAGEILGHHDADWDLFPIS